MKWMNDEVFFSSCAKHRATATLPIPSRGPRLPLVLVGPNRPNHLQVGLEAVGVYVALQMDGEHGDPEYWAVDLDEALLHR